MNTNFNKNPCSIPLLFSNRFCKTSIIFSLEFSHRIYLEISSWNSHATENAFQFVQLSCLYCKAYNNILLKTISVGSYIFCISNSFVPLNYRFKPFFFLYCKIFFFSPSSFISDLISFLYIMQHSHRYNRLRSAF